MAKSTGRLTQPKGSVVLVGADERERIRKKRLELGWQQKELAAKVGCSYATISNLETGRHPQINRGVYAKIYKALKLGDMTEQQAFNEESWHAIVTGSLEITDDDRRVVAALIDQLKQRKTR